MVHTQNDRRCRLSKVLHGLILALVIFVVFSLIMTVVLFHLMFGRSELNPVNLEEHYSDVDPVRYPRTPVRFYSGDNRLQGYYYEAAAPAGIVVMVHGVRDGADSHLPETLYFVDHGWTVFCFNGTGTRESDGSGIKGLAQLKLDLMAAIRYVTEDRPGCPILLYGHSQGAYSAAAVLDDFPSVSAAVCVAGFDTPLGTMYYHAHRWVGPLATVEYPFLYLYNYLLFGDEGNESAASAIAEGDTPVLLVYGSDDTTVPAPISLYERCDELDVPNTSYLLIEDAPRNRHSTAWRTEESAAYFLEKAGELDELRRTYGQTLPQDVTEEYLSGLDRGKLWVLDQDFMDSVQDFFLRAVA